MAANEAAAHVFALTTSEGLVGRAVEDFIDPSLAVAHRAYRDDFRREPSRRRMGRGRQLTARRSDGAEFPAEIGINGLEGPDGPMAIVLISDVSERVRLADQLQVSEAYRSLVDAIPAITYVETVEPTSGEPITTFVSPQVQSLLGISPEEWIANSMSWLDLVHPDDRDRVRAASDEASRMGSAYEARFRITGTDGVEHWFQDQATPVRDASGEIGFWQGLMIDITEQQSLTQRDALYSSLLRQMPNAIIGASLDRRVTYWGGAAERFTGRTADEMIGSIVTEVIVPPERAGEVDQIIMVDVVRDGNWRGEVPLVHRDGSVTAMHWDVVATRRSDGEVDGLMAIGTDISGPAATFEALRESEASLARSQKLAGIGSWEVDFSGGSDPGASRASWSDQTFRIFGYEPRSIAVTQETFFDAVHTDDLPAIRAAMTRMAEGESAELEHRIVRPDGTIRWIVNTVTRDLDPETGSVRRLHGVAMDVTQRREALRAEFDAVTAERANAAKTEFLSRMSHELRTPLNAILGFGQLLELDPLEERQGENVRQILLAGHHLLGLVNEILDIAQIESGELRVILGPVLVRDAIADAVELMGVSAREAEVELVGRPDQLWERSIFADRDKLQQVLMNLIDNGIRFGGAGSLVTVSCAEAPGGRLRIQVQDSGPGIPAERLDDIWTPFERLDAAARGVPGTGLGLTLARRIAEAMGGSLLVESTPGEGSLFAVELPESGDDRPTPPSAEEASRSNPEQAPRSRTVLSIEDNESVLLLLARLLERHPEIELIPATSAAQGIELARLHRPDVVLLDLHLPDAGGETVLSALKGEEGTEHIPVIVLSADAHQERIDEILAAGAAGYLTKPLDLDELLAVLNDI